MLFSCSPGGIKHRIIDVSHQAVESGLFPLSVGLRSQALKLKFVTPETSGRFLQPTRPFEEITGLLDKRFSSCFPKPVIHQAYIGDTLSLIYAPHYAGKRIFDAVLNQPVSPQSAEDFDVSSFKGGRPRGSIRFLPTICPNCGWDLKGQRDALVLECENCSSVWAPAKNGFVKLSASYLPGRGDQLVYMPFWRIKAETEGIVLDSYADLIRAANMPKAVQKGMENTPFYFWSLAFKVRPQIFLRLTKNITLSQPAEKLSPGSPRERKHPVTLPLKEAVESLKLTLAGFLKPRQKLMQILPEIKITSKDSMLVYLPFHERPHELVQPTFTMAIHKNMLVHARNL